MTKLESKLIELGYVYNAFGSCYKKKCSKSASIYFFLTNDEKNIHTCGVEHKGNGLKTREHLNDFDQALDILQEDLHKLLGKGNFTTVLVDEACKVDDVPREWYESEIERLNIENAKLKKLVDILLEREKL